jgi:hypothetical protein
MSVVFQSIVSAKAGQRCVSGRVALVCRLTFIVLLWSFSVSDLRAQSSQQEETLPSRDISVAQTELAPVVTLTEEHMRELDDWMREFAAWQKWADRWLNRRQPGKLVPAADRRPKPSPPDWLNGVCVLLGSEEEFKPACEMLAAWKENPAELKTHRAAAAATAQKEAPTKTLWWQRMHLDGLWSTAQSNVSAFALFGAHLTIEVEGRLQVFAAPGILLMSVPGLHGRELKPATDWGITYRFFNVGRSTVHFNLVQAWVLGNQPALTGNPNMTLAGLSLTFNGNRRR